MLKFFADECIHQDIISILRQSGFDILTVREADLTGSDDKIIFDFANKNQRILLSYDRGFGDIFRFNISKSFGIIIVLINKMEKSEIAKIILGFISTIENQKSLNGKLVIIAKTKIRIRTPEKK